MTVNTCPNRDLLRDYLQGKLPSIEAELLDEHLNQCPHCQTAADTLDDFAGSDLARFVDLGNGQDTVSDPLLRQLLSRAKAIWSLDRESVAGGAGAVCPDLVPGQTLGNYELRELIGRGGMGQVFKACHRRMKRIVALKILSSELLPTRDLRDRFDREIETAALLTHRHIVTAYDAGEDQGRVFLAMEYVDGSDLARLIQQGGPLPLAVAVSYVLQAARGLAHAHAAGIVHRDIKPANLLVDLQGVVKVSDLGLARLFLREEQTGEGDLTGPQTVMGTAAYMAPEQALDPRQADHRADIYSLGCTLYFLLTGQPPFAGKSSLEVLYAHRDQPIPSLAGLRTDFPAALDGVLQKMLAKKPEDRFAGMPELVAALDEVATGMADSSLLSRSPEQVPGNEEKAVLESPVFPSVSPSESLSHLRRRWLLAGISLALAAALIFALMYLNPEQFPDNPSGNSTLVQHPGTGPMLSVPKVDGVKDGSNSLISEKPRPPVIEMVQIRNGDFLMGASDSDLMALQDEKPQRKIKISQPFFLGKYEVTQLQFQQVMGKNPSAFSPRGRFKEKVAGIDTSHHPVESVTWGEAILFCNRLSEMHGLTPFYQLAGEKVTVRGGPGFRLPTEAEWEYACRAGTSTIWSFGNDHGSNIDHFAWYAENSGGKTHPVGTKKPNPFGLFDMHGNVPEWCWDRYDAEFYKKSAKEYDPVGPGTGTDRVYRGGAWDLGLAKTRSSARTSLNFTAYGHYLTIVGFRVARNAE